MERLPLSSLSKQAGTGHGVKLQTNLKSPTSSSSALDDRNRSSIDDISANNQFFSAVRLLSVCGIFYTQSVSSNSKQETATKQKAWQLNIASFSKIMPRLAV